MRFLALIALCLFALLSLTVAQEEEEFCPCPRNFEPVCGSDSVTYSNQCNLRCQATKAARQGRSLTLIKQGKC